MHDVIVIGAGPAGITSAVYCARKQLNVLVLTENIGGQAATSAAIENYTGFQIVTGPQLAEKFNAHLKEFDVEVLEGKSHLAQKIEKTASGTFTVSTPSGVHDGRCVVIASGAHPRELGVPGEQQFKYKGIAYCATCDAPMFRNKAVAVIGGGNSALDALIQLEPIASKTYAVVRESSFSQWADKIMVEKAISSPKIETIYRAETKEFFGKSFLEGIKLEVAGSPRTLEVQGAFIEIGWVPNSQFVGPEVARNKSGEIIVNDRCETSVPGLFAAGDVSSVPYKQIIIAAGQGSIAALSAFEYLSRRK